MQSTDEPEEGLKKHRSNGEAPTITPSQYYQQMRELALQKRADYQISTPQVTLTLMRQIYKKEGIVIDATKNHLRKLKAAYFNDSDGCSVFLNISLPLEPRLFAMVHELKHHYVDSAQLQCMCLDAYGKTPEIEIGAEIFAAEFLFPVDEFRQFATDMGVTRHASQADIVNLNYRSPARVSYQYILKRLEWLKLIGKNEYKGFSFQNLHTQMYGSHHYHRRHV